MVMSSVRTSYSSHMRWLSCTTARHASKGSSKSLVRLQTVWLVKNSNTPSEPTTTKRSHGCSGRWSISGDAMTPRLSATRSPMERVKAVPG